MYRFRRAPRDQDHAAAPSDAERDWRYLGEFDAFLGGVYVEWTLERGRLLPQWAWINPLAHATQPELEARAGYHPAGAPTDLDIWWQVVGFLADQLLARTKHDPDALAVLQRDVLVPLELHAAATWITSIGPSDFGTLVLRVVDTAPRGGH